MVGLGFILSACASSGPQLGEQQRSGYHRGQPSYKVGSAYQINGKWYYPKADYGTRDRPRSGMAGVRQEGDGGWRDFNLNELSAAHEPCRCRASSG
jgi:hypothetical protein